MLWNKIVFKRISIHFRGIYHTTKSRCVKLKRCELERIGKFKFITLQQEKKNIQGLPILWPTGVEKGFPKRNSIVSPRENILKRPLDRRVLATVDWAWSVWVSFWFVRLMRRSRGNSQETSQAQKPLQIHRGSMHVPVCSDCTSTHKLYDYFMTFVLRLEGSVSDECYTYIWFRDHIIKVSSCPWNFNKS